MLIQQLHMMVSLLVSYTLFIMENNTDDLPKPLKSQKNNHISLNAYIVLNCFLVL